MAAEVGMQSTSKILPSWQPSFEKRGYPLHFQDLGLWAAGTELQHERIAPAVAQRIGGVAWTRVRHIPTRLLTDGQQKIAVVWETSLEILLRDLTRRFGGFPHETAQKAIVELLSFRQLEWESVDNALGRCETLQATSEELGSFIMGFGTLAWMLLTAMGISRNAWPMIL